MIFVTLGSQKFQFNRLLKKIDELIDKGVINEKVFAQSGYSDYIPKCYEYKQFLDRDEFSDLIEKCDMVITHGGTGVIINAVKKGKKVIAAPRLARFGEHVDDHQLQLLDQFKEMNMIESCYDIDSLENSYITAQNKTYNSYSSNTQVIIDDIEKYIAGIRK